MLHDTKAEARIEEELFHNSLSCEQRILLKAVDVLNHVGWGRCAYRSSDGRVCAVGAIRIAAGFGPQFITTENSQYECYLRALHTLERTVGSPTVEDWNDYPSTYAAEVKYQMLLAALG